MSESIQRVTYINPKVHIYSIPPLRSVKGHVASAWTESPSSHIFTARLRVLETSSSSASTPSSSSSSSRAVSGSEDSSAVSVSLLLEDPSSGELFAEAPYTVPAVVEAALDSSRFFAVRVQGEGGRRATLGLGFEERSEALDFSIALQDARKVLGITDPESTMATSSTSSKGSSARKQQTTASAAPPKKRDWSLKSGEVLHVDIKPVHNLSLLQRQREQGEALKDPPLAPPSAGLEEFKLAPPPGPALASSSSSSSSSSSRGGRRKSVEHAKTEAMELGFDDGEFGEFQ